MAANLRPREGDHDSCRASRSAQLKPAAVSFGGSLGGSPSTRLPYGTDWLSQERNCSFWSTDERIEFALTHESKPLIELVGSWKRCLQVTQRLRLIGNLQHWCEQGSPDSVTLDRRLDTNECQVPMGAFRMEVFHGNEPCEQAL